MFRVSSLLFLALVLVFSSFNKSICDSRNLYWLPYDYIIIIDRASEYGCFLCSVLETGQTSLSSRGNDRTICSTYSSSCECILHRTQVHFTCEENNSPFSRRNAFQTGYYELVTKASFPFLDIDFNWKAARNFTRSAFIHFSMVFVLTEKKTSLTRYAGALNIKIVIKIHKL